jgi:aspartyl-tRNA(Asn)/glutamyl-tRNA(Gln) amidotransferase subunit C
MSITKDQAKKIAHLARIHVSDQEAEDYAQELTSILAWVEQLQAVDTEGVPQMTSVVEMALPMRADEVTDGHYPEKIVQNAPTSQYGCFAVPKVVE